MIWTMFLTLLLPGPCIDYTDDFHSIITYNACPAPEPAYECPPRGEMKLAILARCGGAGPPDLCTFKPDRWTLHSLVVPEKRKWDGLFEALYEYEGTVIREALNKCWPPGTNIVWSIKAGPGSPTLQCHVVRYGFRCKLDDVGMWELTASRGSERATFIVVHK